jgi:hypothetical protein
VPYDDVIEGTVQDHPHRRIVRIGDTVRRPAQPWTPEVHALLTHLQAVGLTVTFSSDQPVLAAILDRTAAA